MAIMKEIMIKSQEICDLCKSRGPNSPCEECTKVIRMDGLEIEIEGDKIIEVKKIP